MHDTDGPLHSRTRVLQDVQADCPIRIHVAVVDLRGEMHLASERSRNANGHNTASTFHESAQTAAGLWRLEGVV